MNNQPIVFRCPCGEVHALPMAQIYYAGATRCHSLKCQTDALLEMAGRARSVTVDDLEDEHTKGMVTE